MMSYLYVRCYVRCLRWLFARNHLIMNILSKSHVRCWRKIRYIIFFFHLIPVYLQHEKDSVFNSLFASDFDVGTGPDRDSGASWGKYFGAREYHRLY